jgi:hypothetical protein
MSSIGRLVRHGKNLRPDVRVGSSSTESESRALVRYTPDSVAKPGHVFAAGFEHWSACGFSADSLWRRYRQALGSRLGCTGDGRGWQRAVEELDEAPQSKSVEPEDSFHVSKTHLDLFAFPTRLFEGLGFGQRASDVAGVLMEITGNLPHSGC